MSHRETTGSGQRERSPGQGLEPSVCSFPPGSFSPLCAVSSSCRSEIWQPGPTSRFSQKQHPQLSQGEGRQCQGSGCKSVPCPVLCLCTRSTLKTAVAPGKLHQGPLCISPPLYRVHDLCNGAIWAFRAAFRGYRDVGRRQHAYSLKRTPVSGQATGAVFMHLEVKAELHFACNGTGVAEPRLNNQVMLWMGFSSGNLC